MYIDPLRAVSMCLCVCQSVPRNKKSYAQHIHAIKPNLIDDGKQISMIQKDNFLKKKT